MTALLTCFARPCFTDIASPLNEGVDTDGCSFSRKSSFYNWPVAPAHDCPLSTADGVTKPACTYASHVARLTSQTVSASDQRPRKGVTSSVGRLPARDVASIRAPREGATKDQGRTGETGLFRSAPREGGPRRDRHRRRPVLRKFRKSHRADIHWSFHVRPLFHGGS